MREEGKARRVLVEDPGDGRTRCKEQFASCKVSHPETPINSTRLYVLATFRNKRNKTTGSMTE